MNIISRTITGGAMIIIGIFLVFLPLLIRGTGAAIVSWIYGIPIFVIGVFILLNKKEDEIEKIKSEGGKK